MRAALFPGYLVVELAKDALWSSERLVSTISKTSEDRHAFTGALVSASQSLVGL